MTDEAIICAWMELKPQLGPLDMRPWQSVSVLSWWVAAKFRKLDTPNEWYPRPLTLDALWEVEERLTAEQRGTYYRALHTPDERDSQGRRVASRSNWDLLHATPAQKVAALVAVLRPLVEVAK